MKKNKIVYFLFTLLLLSSCSTTKVVKIPGTKKLEKKKLLHEVNLNVEKNIGWINLMPGAEPKFHISGSVGLLKGNNYNLETTELKYIKVFQSGKELYFIKPKIRVEEKKDLKKYLYSTISGLSLVKDLNPNKKLELEFIFKDGSKEFIYQINNVEFQEVH